MSTLTQDEISALHEALDDEYKAWAIYGQVIADFGEVRPFTNIRDAEARHIEALLGLFARYGLPVPANPWPNKVPRYANLHEACEAGVAAEVANAALYDKLIASTHRPDVLAVYRNLQEASQLRHLEAFQRCVQRGKEGGGGHGQGRGRMHRGGRGPS